MTLPTIPAKKSRKRYIKGQAWCNYCKRVISAKDFNGRPTTVKRCPICMRRGKWLTKIEDKVSRGLMVDVGLPLNLLYLEDNRVVDRDTGEIVNALGRVIQKELDNSLGVQQTFSEEF